MDKKKLDPEFPLLRSDIADALRRSGLARGENLIAHVSLSSLGWVVGGAETILRAIFELIGPEGSLMMPAQTWKNLDPSTGVHWEVSESLWPLIRREWPAFDPLVTPAIGMGAVPEMLRTWPGSVRSCHPARSFCANGPKAAQLMADHDLSNIFGEGSPLAKLYDLDGSILLLGVGHDKNTSLHLAESRAAFVGKKTTVEHSAVMKDGAREWLAYETLAVDDSDFIPLGSVWEAAIGFKAQCLGKGEARLIKMRPFVDWAVGWMEKNRGA